MYVSIFFVDQVFLIFCILMWPVGISRALVLPQEKVCTRVLTGSPTTLQTRYCFPFHVPLPNSTHLFAKILLFINQHSHDLETNQTIFCYLDCHVLMWRTGILVILNECRPDWTILLFHDWRILLFHGAHGWGIFCRNGAMVILTLRLDYYCFIGMLSIVLLC